MKTLGLLGGMTFHSTALYYDLINRHVRSQLGPQSSARIFIYSANQEEMLQYAKAGNWDAFAKVYVDAAMALISGGAEAIVICASLAHKVAARIEKDIDVPLLHMADFLALELKDRGIDKVGLLGTKVVMEGNFITGRMQERYLETLVPDSAQEREAVNNGIVNELTTGQVSVETKRMFMQAAKELVNRGAGGLILGSTDLGFVLSEDDVPVPIFDSAKIHALGAAKWALAER